MAEEDKNYYSVLQCDITASNDVINKAARKLSLKYHPDKNPDPAASKLFQDVQEAKEFLLDEDKRKAYDDKLSAALKRKAHEAEKLSKMGESRKRFKQNLEQRLQVEKSADHIKNVNGSSSSSSSSRSDNGGAFTNQQQQQSTVDFSKRRKTINKSKNSKVRNQSKIYKGEEDHDDIDNDEEKSIHSLNQDINKNANIDVPLNRKKSMMVDVMKPTDDGRPPLPVSYAEFIEKEARIFKKLGLQLNLKND